jgi:hypothetical protein
MRLGIMPKKDEALQEIAEHLSSISDSLDVIQEELDDICMTGKIMTFFKMIELRPEMKEKLRPLIDEMVASIDLEVGES